MSLFRIQVESGEVGIYSFGEYHPFKKNGEKNLKFDRHSGYILSTKDKAKIDYTKSVTHFTRLMRELTPKLTLPKTSLIGPQVSIVIIPGSAPGKVSPGLTAIMKNICALDKRFILAEGALIRTKEIKKLATGGNRHIYVHKNSITLDASKLDTTHVMVVDDVLTTGNSFIACCDIIKKTSPHHLIFGVILGKTAHE